MHQQDKRRFEINWAEFLEGQKPIDLSSLIESDLVPSDDLAKDNFGYYYYWYRLKRCWVIPLLDLYYSLRNYRMSNS